MKNKIFLLALIAVLMMPAAAWAFSCDEDCNGSSSFFVLVCHMWKAANCQTNPLVTAFTDNHQLIFEGQTTHTTDGVALAEPQRDNDTDGIPNSRDNCPYNANGNQFDFDRDGQGDACTDTDNDGVMDFTDNCADVVNPDQADVDEDGMGDACEQDSDSDGYPDDDDYDNCPFESNPTQRDSDGDKVGDLCDNCKNVPNFDQLDIDGDGTGDACEINVSTPPANITPPEPPPPTPPPIGFSDNYEGCNIVTGGASGSNLAIIILMLFSTLTIAVRSLSFRR